MTFTNIPTSISSPWTDPYGQVWVWNGVTWTRFDDLSGKVGEAPVDSKQYIRQDSEWNELEPSGVYIGALSSPPSMRENGDFIQIGDCFFNLTTLRQMVFTGRRWELYGDEFDITNIDEYIWLEHPAVPVGDALLETDDYENSFPASWIKGKHIILMFNEGKNLVQQEDVAGVLGKYKVFYSDGKITATNTPIVAGRVIVQVLTLAKRELKIYPYTSYIRFLDTVEDPGMISTPPDPSPSVPKDFYISGGNFDQSTRIIVEEPSLQISVINIVQDSAINISVLGYSPTTPVNARISVINGVARHSFGTDLLLPDMFNVGTP